MLFFFDSQLTAQIQNKTKYCDIKGFYKTHNQWNYFQRGCMDKWRSGDFSIQTWYIPLEAFASKNEKRNYNVPRIFSSSFDFTRMPYISCCELK